MNDNQMIIYNFYGTVLKKKIDLVIIIPINMIYEVFVKTIIPLKEFKGWWKSSFYSFLNFDVWIIQSPQGPAIKDIIYSLKEYAKAFCFIGWCGAISDSLDVGDEVRVIKAINKNSTIDKKMEAIYGVCNVRSKVVDCFLEEEQMINAIDKKDIDVVDMESYYVYEALEASNVYGEVWMVVTDHLAHTPFFKVNEIMYNEIFKKTSKMILNSINYFRKIAFKIEYKECDECGDIIS